jgi:predicted amidohydrolase
MRLTVLELRASWNDAARVLDDIAALVAIAPTDLVLVPEAAICGYVSPQRDFDLTPFAEPLDGSIARHCAAIAIRAGVHLVAPLVLREDAHVYNAMACFAPDGRVPFVYRKRHPWVPETWATPGPVEPPVVEICGRAVTIAICYDLQFVDDDMVAQLTAADVMLFASAWVERPDSRPARLAELAQQFDLHIANANWAQGVVRVPGQGGSAVYAPDGTTLARAGGPGRIDAVIASRR